MKKLLAEKSKRTKIILIVGVTLLVVLLAGYLGRGWLRKTVAPKFVTATYGHSVDKTAHEELAKLNDPFASLGYGKPEVFDDNCKMLTADGLSTWFGCTYNANGYREVSQNPADQAALNATAAKIQKLLKDNGWDGEFSDDTDYTSLVKLVSNINKGIDYTPDATYQKIIGDVSCWFSSTTAFSAPKAPAISTHFNCSRDVFWFGAHASGFEM